MRRARKQPHKIHILSQLPTEVTTGNASFAGISIPFLENYKIVMFTQAPGGFLVYGLIIALVNKITAKSGGVKKKSFSCEGCPSSATCGKASCTTKEEISETENSDVKEADENA